MIKIETKLELQKKLLEKTTDINERQKIYSSMIRNTKKLEAKSE